MGCLLNMLWISLLSLVLGFLWFVAQIPGEGALSKGPQADAIVVLTGGSGRVEAGAALMQQAAAERLYISGTHRSVKKRELFRAIPLPKQVLSCCVTLDPIAENTRGNARETAAWLRALNAQRVILVTADYHMPRSLLEFRANLPEMTIVPFAVQEPTVNAKNWWNDGATTRVLAYEYIKYLMARATLTRVGAEILEAENNLVALNRR